MKPEEIRAWRESKGMDRKRLAELCSVSAATVANWELGRNEPHGAAAERLGKLMSGESSQTPLTALEERLLNELVRRGGYASREELLTALVVERIKMGE